MSDLLGEALAWVAQGEPPMPGSSLAEIVAAARNWHALTTPQHASNGFTVTCCDGAHEVRIKGELVAWCRFHRAAGDADKDCWGAGLDGQDSCYPVPALIVLDALTDTADD